MNSLRLCVSTDEIARLRDELISRLRDEQFEHQRVFLRKTTCDTFSQSLIDAKS